MLVDNLIIGAGPAGLAMAGTFRNAHMDFEIIEETNKVASKWRQHYDRLHLHTVKKLSNLPFLKFPEAYPKYISKDDLVLYYEQYAEKFSIKPHFNTKAINVYKNDKTWIVECNDKEFIAKNVIVATGINRIPKIPKWKGQEHFAGKIFHASKYKNTKNLIGKRVLVVGMGNTGAEIALDLAENNIEVGITVRSEVIFVPRDILGNSIQESGKRLEKLPFGLGDVIGNLTRKLYFGNLKKYGLPISSKSPVERLKTTGKTPIIDLGTVAKIKSGHIKVLPDIVELNSNEVAFIDGRMQQFDVLILATGYYAQVNDFIESKEGVFDESGTPKLKVGNKENEGLYFIGFDNYRLGGILGTLEEDSSLILEGILGGDRNASI